MTKQPRVTLSGSNGEWSYSAERGGARVYGEVSGFDRSGAEACALRHLAEHLRGAASTDPSAYGSLRRERDLRGEDA